jgi:EmrB/QacA subfamily drug resistance transporter
MDGSTSPGASEAEGVAGRRGEARPTPGWLVLSLACLGQFMVVLDISIVNVALPSIRHDLGISASDLQWVVNAYTLALGGFLLLGGRAADLFGRRRMFIAGLAIFTAASLAGGFASSLSALVLSRALKGLGAAVLAPATLTIITTLFPEGRDQARAIGVWSSVAAVGATSGALLGGLLTDLISWRWILFVNVPIGTLVLVGAWLYLPESRGPDEDRRLDVLGALTVTGALVGLVYAIVRTETNAGVSAQTLVPLTIGAALFVVFLLVELRLARAPLVPLRIFRSRSVAGANVFMLLLFGAMFGAFYFETLYMQGILGYSALRAGTAFLPQTVMLALAAQVASRLVTRLGSRPLLVAGTVVSAAGLAWLSQITPQSEFLTDMLGPFLLIGAGIGLCVTPVTVAGTAGVPPAEAGLASGLLNASRTVGASIGLATLATVASARAAALVMGGVATPARTAAALTSGYALAIGVSAVALLAGGLSTAFVMPSLSGGGPHQTDSPVVASVSTGCLSCRAR